MQEQLRHTPGAHPSPFCCREAADLELLEINPEKLRLLLEPRHRAEVPAVGGGLARLAPLGPEGTEFYKTCKMLVAGDRER